MKAVIGDRLVVADKSPTTPLAGLDQASSTSIPGVCLMYAAYLPVDAGGRRARPDPKRKSPPADSQSKSGR